MTFDPPSDSIGRSEDHDPAAALPDPGSDYEQLQPDWDALYSAQVGGRAPRGLHRLSDVAVQPLSWLWPGRVPLGKLTMLDGDPGLGKSTLLLDLAARLTTGRPMPDADFPQLPLAETGPRTPSYLPLPTAPSTVAPSPSSVVLLSAEDAMADTLRPRLEAAGADLERVFVLTNLPMTLGAGLPEIPRDAHYIEASVESMRATLLVIDPLVAYFGRGVSAYRDQDVRRALAHLTRLAEATGAAVVAVRHLSKVPTRNPLYRAGGSIGILGAARSALLATRDPDDPTDTRRILATYKSNLAQLAPPIAYRILPAPNGASTIVWEGTTRHTAADLLAQPAPQLERDTLDDARSTLATILAGGPVLASDVIRQAREAGLGPNLLRRAKIALGVRSRKQGHPSAWGQAWVWELPDERRQAHEDDGAHEDADS